MTDTSFCNNSEGKTISIKYDITETVEADTRHRSSDNNSKISITAQSGESSQIKSINFLRIREKEAYIRINKRLGD